MTEPGRKRPSPIAASEKAKGTLKRISEALSIQQIDLLDQAVTALEEYYRHHGNRLLLPLRFTQSFTVFEVGREHLTLHEPPRRTKVKDRGGVKVKL